MLPFRAQLMTVLESDVHMEHQAQTLPVGVTHILAGHCAQNLTNGAERFEARLSALGRHMGPVTPEEHVAAMLDHAINRGRSLAVRVILRQTDAQLWASCDFIPLATKKGFRVSFCTADGNRMLLARSATAKQALKHPNLRESKIKSALFFRDPVLYGDLLDDYFRSPIRHFDA